MITANRLVLGLMLFPLFGSPGVQAQDRKYFSYLDSEGKSGVFVLSRNGEWVETTGTGEKHTFREVSRDEKMIELFDSERGGVGVRLANAESLWRHQELTQGEWRSLWKGRWVVVTKDRNHFTYTDSEARSGNFIHSPAGEWIETTGTGEKHVFREVGRDEKQIELFDPERGGVGVRLGSTESFWFQSELTEGQWRELWKGNWVRPAQVVRTAAQFSAAEQYEFEGIRLSMTLEQFLAKYPNAKQLRKEQVAPELQLQSYLIFSKRATMIEVEFINQRTFRYEVDYSPSKVSGAGGKEKLVEELLTLFGESEPKDEVHERHWNFKSIEKKSGYLITQKCDDEGFTIGVCDHLTWEMVQTELRKQKK